MIKIEGTLPVAIKALDGQTEIKSKNIVMRQMTAEEYLNAQAETEAGQYLDISELTSMTKLVDEHAVEHSISYDMLAKSSKSNLKYLREKRDELEAKELAED